MSPALSVSAVTKTYKSGQVALHEIDLTVEKGEIFALLGPNGAGKTTLISIICGLVSMTSGRILVDGHDIIDQYRTTRAMIGLVPQEIALDIFATVEDTMRFSRGLFGKRADSDHIHRLLRDLSLWEKRRTPVIELSGGMKRRVMIAKALSHEPDILFLDEPTAGVDVSLRRDMWELVRQLRDRGVTIILTTHYIEEAEEMADRVGVIDRGRLVLVEETAALMRKLGRRRLSIIDAAADRGDPARARRLAVAAGGRGRTPRLRVRRERIGHRYCSPAANPWRRRDRLQGSRDQPDFARGYLRGAGGGAGVSGFNLPGMWAIYRTEMMRTRRTVWQSVATPVITTMLYFIVFGGAIGSRMQQVGGVGYGSFIVPGLIMLTLLTQGLLNASVAIYFPKFTHTIFELLSAPISSTEAVFAYIGAAATKSVLIGLIILATATFFVPVQILHPGWMVAFLVLTAVSFGLFGFVIGIWAESFEQLAIIPSLVVTPLTFLGGAFYSIDMLPQPWRTVSLFNPVVYLISGFRWSFYGVGDVDVAASLAFVVAFMVLCLVLLWWIFRTGYRLKP